MNSNQIPANDSVQDYERLKSALVSLISHELRTPLTYVSASLEMIEIALETPDMQAEIRRFLNIIAQGVKQLHTTIDELLLFSNLENALPEQQAVAIHEAVDLRNLTCEVVNILKPSYQAKKQVLEVSIQENLPPLTTDSGKLSEVLIQLLSNAIKFTPTGGHIRIMVIGTESHLTVIISDNGPGIPAEIRQWIFDPFFQQEDPLIREHGGLGLGLTLVQRLCHLLGGELRLEVEAPPQTGTTFVLELPRVNPIFQKHQEMRQMLSELKLLTRANAEKEAQLQGLKGQLLQYTEALTLATQSNQQKQGALENMYVEMIQGLAFALETRDPYTRGRARRIFSCADLLAEALGLSSQERDTLEKACLLCDLGYIGIPDQILHKNQQQNLSAEEIHQIQSHPMIGAELLKHIQAFDSIVPLVLSHHENWNGSGYPQGLRGEEIPLLARIIRLADAFEAMISDRAYRRPRDPESALGEIEAASGIQFDPELVKLFIGLWQTGRLQPFISSLESNSSEKGDSV